MEEAENTGCFAVGEEKPDNTEIQELLKNLPQERQSDGRSLYFYQGFWCPSVSIHPVIAFLQHFQAHDTDLILASSPKSGTTWLKALIFTIVNRTTHELTKSPLLSANPHELVLSLEQTIFKNPSSNLVRIPKPRIFSTHVPYAALPISIKNSNCRVVYVCRNPIDQFISDWHFGSKLWSQTHYSIPVDESFNKFCHGVSMFGPFWNHMLGYWKASQETQDKVLFLKYEDLKEDIMFHAKLLAKFLGFPFSAEEEREGVVEEIVKLCSFDNLKGLEVNKNRKHPSGHDYSDFFRRGKIGDWSNYLTPQMAEKMKQLIEEKIRGSGLTFKMS